jgi:hypothetical protein
VDELKRLDLENMPEDIRISIFDDYFPETTIWREGELVVCEIQEHLYTKYWEHKFSAYAFAEAMERAVRRLAHEGHPFADTSRNDEDVHIFVRWQLKLPRSTCAGTVADSIKSAFDLVWHRADSILENSDSVLILGKHIGTDLDRLKPIASTLEKLGYYAYIIKEQPDRVGESIVQKVMRYALSSKFVLIENTEASGEPYHRTSDVLHGRATLAGVDPPPGANRTPGVRVRRAGVEWSRGTPAGHRRPPQPKRDRGRVESR